MAQHTTTNSVEQLWYTWSTTGLDALTAGFRVRAASPGLTDLYGERMKQLDRYLRYSLPSGADPLHTRSYDPRNIHSQEDAPVCLAFVRTESGERVLVHKVYTGKDGRGRHGAYFAHMLAKLPTDFFSARDAIRFWRSPFWHTADVPAHERGTDLSDVALLWQKYSPVEMRYQDSLAYRQRPNVPVISLEECRLEIPRIRFEDLEVLERQFIDVGFRQPDTVSGTQFKTIGKQGSGPKSIYEHLCFILRAFLLRQNAIEEQENERKSISKDIEERRQKIDAGGRSRGDLKQLRLIQEEKEALLQLMMRRESPRIFIAAPPDQVAYLIAGLTRLLPRHFLKSLTFSTYENDVLTKLPLDIVGTCPPSVSLDSDSAGRDILPLACYRKGFALNTYLEKSSPLDGISLKDVVPGELEDAVPDEDYVEHYAHFAVEELQRVARENEQSGKQEHRQEHEATPYMLTPIDELDQLFNKLSDLPEARIDTLPELSVYDFLYAYYRYVVKKQLSLTEITLILRDPATALEELRKSSFRKQIFVRVYRDPAQPPREDRETGEEHHTWLQNTLPGLLTNLCHWCQSPSGPARANAGELGELLDALAGEAAMEVYKASTQDDLDRFLAIFIPLRALVRNAGLWIDLLTWLYEDQRSRNFIDKYWVVHEVLLGIAIMVLTPDSPIASFLLNVYPALLGKLLAFLQRITYSSESQSTAWQHRATQLFLQKGSPRSARIASGALWYESEIVRALEEYFPQVKTLIAQLLKSPRGAHRQLPYAQWRMAARDLFLALVNSGCEDQYKMELLWLWFEDAVKRGEIPDLPPGSIPFSPEEEELVLENYGPALLQLEKGWSVVAPLFWRMVERRAPRKMMEILFKLLDKRVSRENFVGLLDAQKFGAHFNAEEVNMLLLRYSDQYTMEVRLLRLLLYSAQYTKEVCDLLPGYSTQYAKEVHDLLLGCSTQYAKEVYNLPVHYSDQNAKEVHNLLLRHSLRYKGELHELLQQYPDQDTREVDELLMRNPDSYMGEIRELLTRYSTYYTREVGGLLMQYSAQYTKKMHNLPARYSVQNTKEVHDLLLRCSVQYAGEIHKLLKKHSAQYVAERAQLTHNQKQSEELPQYLLLYPDAQLLWEKMVTLLSQAENQQRKMPLVNAWIQAVIEETAKRSKK